MSSLIVEKLKDSNIKLVGEAKESKAGKRFLGTLKGICADLKDSTRNGRMYTEQLWEQVINSEEFKEGMENGTLYGELGHPEDRLETLPERVAIALTDVEFDKAQGKLLGTFDILDTPMGQILKSLVDYGSKLGISSRGGGETVYREGKEYVDESSFRFEAFDIVLLPAVKAARLSLTESKSKKLKALKESVEKIIEKAEDKEAFKGALKDLKSPEIESIVDSLENKNQETMAAESDGANMLKDLQESIEKSIVLEEENAALRDKVTAVSNRETKLVEELEKVKATVRRLSIKTQQSSVSESKIKEYTAQIEQLNEKYQSLELKHKKLLEARETILESKSSIKESLEQGKKENSILKEALVKTKEELQGRIEKLRAVNESIKKDLIIESKKAERKLSEAININKNLNSKLKESLDAYISIVCRQRGIEEQDVKNRLSESYSIQDVDSVVERLSDYKLRIDSLPFATSKVGVSINGSKEPIFESKSKIRIDEDKQASPELLKMLGTK